MSKTSEVLRGWLNQKDELKKQAIKDQKAAEETERKAAQQRKVDGPKVQEKARDKFIPILKEFERGIVRKRGFRGKIITPNYQDDGHSVFSNVSLEWNVKKSKYVESGDRLTLNLDNNGDISILLPDDWNNSHYGKPFVANLKNENWEKLVAENICKILDEERTGYFHDFKVEDNYRNYYV